MRTPETLQPAAPWATAEELRGHCRIDHLDDDALLLGLAQAAETTCELTTGRTWLAKTLALRLDALPAGARPLPIPLGPLNADPLPTLELRAPGATPEDPPVWTASPLGLCGLGDAVAPMAGETWPTEPLLPGGARIVYGAGWTEAPEALPAPVRLGMLQLVAHWYERREAVALDGAASEALIVPYGVAALWAPYRRLRV